MSQAWQSWRRERREAPRRGRLGFLHLPCKREVKEEPITAGAEWGCREEKGRQNKREEGREKGRKEGERLRERGQTTCIYAGGIVYISVLECVAAGGHFDRCGTCVAQLCTEEGRTGGERNTSELPKEMRLRSWVCKGVLREGNGIKKVGQTHVGPFPVFAKF